ncbi:hypothetical protein D3C73_1139960 [compost metagenome]
MQEFCAGAGHVLVPDIQGCLVPGGELAGTCGFQQSIALLQYAVVVAACCGVPRNQTHQQFVQEATSVRRITLDQSQVLGREQHRLADSQYVPCPDRVAAVDASPVCTAGIDLKLYDR